MNPQSLERRGFTFIELMVVALIIGVLVAILLPVFSQAKEKGWQAQCQANLKQIWAALVLYAQEHQGRFPPGNDLAPLFPYLGTEEVFHCPLEARFGSAHGSYVYQGGFGLDSDPRIPLARCLYNHSGGYPFLFADGKVKWFSERFQERGEPVLGIPFEGR